MELKNFIKDLLDCLPTIDKNLIKDYDFNKNKSLITLFSEINIPDSFIIKYFNILYEDFIKTQYFSKDILKNIVIPFFNNTSNRKYLFLLSENQYLTEDIIKDLLTTKSYLNLSDYEKTIIQRSLINKNNLTKEFILDNFHYFSTEDLFIYNDIIKDSEIYNFIDINNFKKAFISKNPFIRITGFKLFSELYFKKNWKPDREIMIKLYNIGIKIGYIPSGSRYITKFTKNKQSFYSRKNILIDSLSKEWWGNEDELNNLIFSSYINIKKLDPVLSSSIYYTNNIGFINLINKNNNHLMFNQPLSFLPRKYYDLYKNNNYYYTTGHYNNFIKSININYLLNSSTIDNLYKIKIPIDGINWNLCRTTGNIMFNKFKILEKSCNPLKK